jgi:hypothetical protein
MNDTMLIGSKLMFIAEDGLIVPLPPKNETMEIGGRVYDLAPDGTLSLREDERKKDDADRA